jgi:hypothetical protein
VKLNPILSAGMDLTVSEGSGWLIVFLGFLAGGCSLLCLTGLSCLVFECSRLLRGRDRPSTLHAEFMGYGVAKERYQPGTAIVTRAEVATPAMVAPPDLGAAEPYTAA